VIKKYIAVLPYWPVFAPKNEDYFFLPSLVAKVAGYKSSLLIYSPKKEEEAKNYQGIDLFFCKTFRNLYKSISKDSIVHIQTTYRSSLLLILLLTLKRKNCRIIWTPHTSFGKRYPLGFNFDIFKIAFPVFKKIDKIIAITEFERQYLEKLGYRNIVYTPLVTDVKNFSRNKRREKTKEFNFLFIGGGRKVKGLATVLKAFSVFGKFGINSNLFILGRVSNSFKKKYCDLINNKVKFFGVIKPCSNHLVDLFGKSNCYINASFQEGSPLAALEAAASGLFLCLPDLRTLKSIFGDNAFYYKIGSWLELIETMFLCFYNVEISRKKIARNEKLMREFSCEKFEIKFTCLLRSLSS